MRLTLVSSLAAGLLTVASHAGAQEPFNLEVAPQVGVFVASGHSFLGVGVADVNAERAKALKLKEERGVEITRVEQDSPAAKAGLKVGDVVIEYNGQRIEGTEQFVRMVRETPAGRQAKLTVSRDGATQNLTATVAARKGGSFLSGADAEKWRADAEKFRADMEKFRTQMKAIPDVPRPSMSWQSGTLGVVAESLDDQLAEFFGVKEGVLVRSVAKDSAAEKAGLKAGDVILKIDEAKVTTPREITSAIRNMRDKKTFPVTLSRNHKEMTVSVTIDTDRSEGAKPAPRPPTRNVGTDPQL